MVFSTLNTKDAATAFPRLLDMGAEDFLVASTVNGILAQRLVRKICGRCIESYELDKTQEQFFGRLDLLKDYLKMLTGKTQLSGLRFFRGKGCQVCHGSGYKGRIGIFELLLMSETIRQAVMDGRSAEEIKQLAIKEGMTTMLYDGLRKVFLAQTTLEEVLRVTRE